MSPRTDGDGIDRRDLGETVIVRIVPVPASLLTENEQASTTVIRDHGGRKVGIVVESATHPYRSDVVADLGTGPHSLFSDNVDGTAYG